MLGNTAPSKAVKESFFTHRCESSTPTSHLGAKKNRPTMHPQISRVFGKALSHFRLVSCSKPNFEPNMAQQPSWICHLKQIWHRGTCLEFCLLCSPFQRSCVWRRLAQVPTRCPRNRKLCYSVQRVQRIAVTFSFHNLLCFSFHPNLGGFSVSAWSTKTQPTKYEWKNEKSSGSEVFQVFVVLVAVANQGHESKDGRWASNTAKC